MNRLGVVLAALVVSSCETIPAVQTHGAEAADEALALTEWAMCNAATVGSVFRRYGTDPELAEAYTRLCLPSRDAVLRLLGGTPTPGPAIRPMPGRQAP